MYPYEYYHRTIFKYPPYQRHVPWRCDADYEMAIVSPVGLGPKGDPLKYEDLSYQDKIDLGKALLEAGIDQGEPGKSAYEVAMINQYGEDPTQWISVERWLTDPEVGIKGDTGSFNGELTDDQMRQIMNWVAMELNELVSTDDIAQTRAVEVTNGTTGVTTVESRDSLTTMFGPSAADDDIYIVTVNGLTLNPWLDQNINDPDYYIHNNRIVFLTPITRDDNIIVRRIKWVVR